MGLAFLYRCAPMYSISIYLHLGHIYGVNLDKYSTHGAYGGFLNWGYPYWTTIETTMVTTGDPPLRTPPFFGSFHPGPLRPRHSSARLLPAERAKEKHLNSGGKIPGLGGPCPSCSCHGTSMARDPWET